jgi:penicillin V acylase-like amidase (Ntn superfamily)
MAQKHFRTVMRFVFSFILPSLIPVPVASPCSRVLWNDNPTAVLVGRTMDWAGSTEPLLTVFPKGLTRDGGILGPYKVIEENALRWTSRYGSLVTTMYGLGAVDGINERGLAAHLHYFSTADFGSRDTTRPGLHAGLWAQYVLDQAATVQEALAALEKIQLVMISARGSRSTLCLAIEDADGDSAIVEFIGGKRVVHHGREFKVMTNDPPYAEQLAALKSFDMAKQDPASLPGSLSAIDRFLRASYYVSILPRPGNETEAVDSLLEVTRHVSVPTGTPFGTTGTYQTEYRTVGDLTNKRYFFELGTASDRIWADLSKLDLQAGAPVLALNPVDASMSGDITARFRAVTAPF